MNKSKMICGVFIGALVFLLVPVCLNTAFSQSTIPWEQGADGLLQYAGTGISAVATLALGYVAYDQNKRLIKLEEDGARCIPELSLTGAYSINSNNVFDEDVQILFEANMRPKPGWSECQRLSLRELDEVNKATRILALQFLVTNHGKSPVVRARGYVDGTSVFPASKGGGVLTIFPNQTTYATIMLPYTGANPYLNMHLSFESLSGNTLETKLSVGPVLVASNNPTTSLNPVGLASTLTIELPDEDTH